MINVAVLGYGTVGSGVTEVLEINKKKIEQRIGDEIHVKYVLDLREFPGDPVQEVLVHDFAEILNDKEVDIVAEVMGGIEPAYTFVKKSLEAGKHVTTSNKALVEMHGAELMEVARANKCNFLFEASVGGGIPIIRPLGTSLTADKIEEISGILNGTTNYMLSKMFYEGADYDEVLKEAQNKGYAEKNPEADVEGYDTGRKIAILASIITEKKVSFEDIYTEGITKITAMDMRYAKKLGMTIKLIASAKMMGENISAMVAPVMIGEKHPLYSVNDVFNAVFVRGNVLGDAMFYGSGAGKLPTASAVVADIVDIARNKEKDIMVSWSREPADLTEKGEGKKCFFVRIAGNRAEWEEQLKESFGWMQIVEIEKEEFAFLTSTMKESEYEIQAEKYNNIISMIRVEE